jgi:hypothetical protein
MFALEFLPFGHYSTTFQFVKDQLRPLFGEGHKFLTTGRKGVFQHFDFVSRSNTTMKSI